MSILACISLIIVDSLVNPSDPNVIFYTYSPRGGVITPPLVKSLFPIEKHVFSSCHEILQTLGHTSSYITKFFPNFDEY